MAQLAVPDEVYWLVNFFDGHSHCTHYRRELSTMSAITASIIQGSSIGPPSCVVNTGDMKPITPGNQMVTFADGTYIIIPAVNANSRQSELINVESWSRVNNLRVNPTKYAEIVFIDKRRKTTVQLPQPMPNVACVSVIKILGITFTNHLSVAEHVQTVITSSAQTLYALRTLRAHGMDDAALQAVFRSVVIAKLTYASSA